MRLSALLVCLLALAAVTNAKLVSVTGQGVILTTPPSNVYAVTTGGIHDDDGPRSPTGQLLVGAFDEQQGLLLTSNVVINSDGVTLLAGQRYDSHFIFFHQATPASLSLSAKANFTTDNKVIACTSNNAGGDDGAYEILTSPTFGLSSVLYPTTTLSARGFEAGDYATGSGTTFDIISGITQPGDFTRCFTSTCLDAAGGACACTLSATSPLCLALPSTFSYKCFNSVNDLLLNTSFTSSCAVDSSSVTLSLGSCDPSLGCYATGGQGFCLASDPRGPSTVGVNGIAGCGCNETFPVSIGVGTTGCLPPDFNPPPTGGCSSVTTFDPSATSATASSDGSCVCLQASP